MEVILPGPAQPRKALRRKTEQAPVEMTGVFGLHRPPRFQNAAPADPRICGYAEGTGRWRCCGRRRLAGPGGKP